MGHALGDNLRHTLRAAEGLLQAMSPQMAALADTLAQVTRRAHGAHGDEVPFLVIIDGRGPSADGTAAVGDRAGMTADLTSALTPLEREIVSRVARGRD